jgi:hypothetical protein
MKRKFKFTIDTFKVVMPKTHIFKTSIFNSQETTRYFMAVFGSLTTSNKKHCKELPDHRNPCFRCIF